MTWTFCPCFDLGQRVNVRGTAASAVIPRTDTAKLMLRCAFEAPVNEASLRLSYRSTLNPRCARCTAARQPTGPAPTTAMLFASMVEEVISRSNGVFFGACHLITSTRKTAHFRLDYKSISRASVAGSGSRRGIRGSSVGTEGYVRPSGCIPESVRVYRVLAESATGAEGWRAGCCADGS